MQQLESGPPRLQSQETNFQKGIKGRQKGSSLSWLMVTFLTCYRRINSIQELKNHSGSTHALSRTSILLIWDFFFSCQKSTPYIILWLNLFLQRSQNWSFMRGRPHDMSFMNLKIKNHFLHQQRNPGYTFLSNRTANDPLCFSRFAWKVCVLLIRSSPLLAQYKHTD